VDFPLGEDAVVAFRGLQTLESGQPIPAASSARYDYSVFGPLSATVPLTSATNVPVSPIGDGWETVNVAASFLTAPGLYRLAVTSTDLGWHPVSIPFRVGAVPRGSWRLRDLLVSLIRATGGSVRTSQSISSAVVTDDYWVSAGSSLDLKGTEVVIVDPVGTSTYADWPRGRVMSFNPATGALTLNRTISPAGDTSGRVYGLTNVQGLGWTYERLLDALQAAWGEVRPTGLASAAVGFATATNQTEYPLPDAFESVAAVGVIDATNPAADYYDDLGGAWSVVPDRRLLRLDAGLGLGQPGFALRVVGGVRCDLPPNGGAWTVIPGQWLRDRARFDLYVTSPLPSDQKTAAALYANLVRQPAPHRRPEPGEVFLR
jgi:hypothetical protein